MSWTVADCIAANARSAPERVAVELLDPRSRGVDPLETWTYHDLWARVEALAHVLRQLIPGPDGTATPGPDGTATPGPDGPATPGPDGPATPGPDGTATPGPDGPMVAILLPNSVDHLAAYLACQHVGAAAVPVNNRLAGPEVEYVLADSGAAVLLAGDPFLELASTAASATGTVVVDVAGVPKDADPSWSGPSGSEAAERIALVAYTSGTTGFPKGSTVTNGGLLTRLAQWSWTFGLSPSQVLSTPGPVFHMSYGGLSLAHLASGGRNRLMVDFDPVVALEEYSRQASWVFLVPSMTAMIVEAWETAGRPSLGRLEWLLSSGAPGPMSLLDRAFDVFPNANITEGYGWTEGGWVTYEVKQRADLVPHSVGWPVLGTQIEVRDEQGEPCRPGEPGEVVARSITPFLGYLGNPDATAASLTIDGFCRSGDVGILLPDGRLSIVDRVKDMIISGGENVYCAEVERILAEHADIAEAAVIGLPDETWGERVTAAVVARPGTNLTAENVIAHCRQRLAAYKCPKQVELLDDLPRNPMGKVQKFRLVDELSTSTIT